MWKVDGVIYSKEHWKWLRLFTWVWAHCNKWQWTCLAFYCRFYHLILGCLFQHFSLYKFFVHWWNSATSLVSGQLSLSPQPAALSMVIMEGCFGYMYFSGSWQSYATCSVNRTASLPFITMITIFSGFTRNYLMLISYILISCVMYLSFLFCCFDRVYSGIILQNRLRDVWFLILSYTCFLLLLLLYEWLFGWLYNSGQEKKKLLFLFLDDLGLHCCVGFCLVVTWGLLTAVASVVEHRL